MIKPSTFIFTLYKGENDIEGVEIDNETIKKRLLSPLIASLDILSKLKELEIEEENEDDGGDET